MPNDLIHEVGKNNDHIRGYIKLIFWFRYECENEIVNVNIVDDLLCLMAVGSIPYSVVWLVLYLTVLRCYREARSELIG